MDLYSNVTLVTCSYLCRLQQGGAALSRSGAKVENLENDGKNYTHQLTIHYHTLSVQKFGSLASKVLCSNIDGI